MIIKCVSRKANVGQLIRYVLAADKVGGKEYETERTNWFIPGIYLTERDKYYLDLEQGYAAMMLELKEKYHGNVQKFIDAQILEARERYERKTNGLKPTVIKQNLRSRSVKGYIKEFEANEQLRLHARKDNVKAYHTILSFSALDSNHITEKIMKDIAQQYISLRGSNSLFVGAVHQDKDHVHIHLIQSGTQYATGIANRISRQQFDEVKRTMQEYQKDKYPQLVHSLPEHGKSQNAKTIGNGAGKNVKTHERTSPDKFNLVTMIDAALAKSSSREHFISKLPKNVEVYYRNGRLQGVLYEDRKYRFSRLGFTEQLKELEIMKEKNEKELKSLQQLRGASRDRLANLEKKEREQPQEFEKVFDISKFCDDCKKKQEDPSYDNPKFYTDGVLDMQKYHAHFFEEFVRTVDMDAYREQIGDVPTVEVGAANGVRETNNSKEVETEDNIEQEDDLDQANNIDRDDDDMER